jgi:hypothetical protein
VLYLAGGSGIGLLSKLKAYELQEQGLDTVEANLASRLRRRQRSTESARRSSPTSGLSTIRVLTNNPRRSPGIAGLRARGGRSGADRGRPERRRNRRISRRRRENARPHAPPPGSAPSTPSSTRSRGVSERGQLARGAGARGPPARRGGRGGREASSRGRGGGRRAEAGEADGREEPDGRGAAAARRPGTPSTRGRLLGPDGYGVLRGRPEGGRRASGSSSAASTAPSRRSCSRAPRGARERRRRADAITSCPCRARSSCRSRRWRSRRRAATPASSPSAV